MDYGEIDSENTAIKRIKRMIMDGVISQEDAEKYCPELIESEDERIRKEIISAVNIYCSEYSRGAKVREDMLAWLEKQGTSYTKRDIDDAYLKGISDAKNEIEKQYEASYQIRKDIATFIFNYKGDIKDRAKWMDYLGIKVSFTEKQGEQTSDKVKLKFKVGDVVRSSNGTSLLIVGITDYCYNCVTCAANDEYSFGFGIQDEFDLVVKIEEGKWYICISQFCNCIEGRAYKATSDSRIMDDFGTEYDMHSDAYKYFRLWTIQDAKDGDVLSYRDGQWIFIYKEKIDDSSFYYHTLYSTIHQDLIIDDIGFTLLDNSIVPATKEQRDTLFTKMHETGYEWDAEKKELKKIEQKTTWSEEDTISRVISIVKWAAYSDHSHPILNDEGATELVERLKSLKDRYTWKLSDEQMRVLDLAIRCGINRGTTEETTLVSLFNDLKKLKG